jgi:hypothetical protein
LISTKIAIKSIATRVRLDFRFGIVSMFDYEPSSDIDLNYLKIGTHDEDADRIAKILRGCRNACKLELFGQADISQVMMKVAGNCHQLETLSLMYKGGRVDGQAMKSLLICCPKLQSFTYEASLGMQAYESLALYGGSLIYLTLLSFGDRDLNRPPSASTNLSSNFDILSNSPIFDPEFKQPRSQRMKSFIISKPHYRNIMTRISFKAFLACFGKN